MPTQSTNNTPIDVKSNTQHSGSYITFVCAETHFALNVDAIKYITSIDAIKIQHTPLENGVMNRIFSFEDCPVVLYSFNKIVGSYSLVNESKKLIEWLATLKQDHINWMIALENAIMTGEKFNHATDPHLCEFGKWYDNFQSKDEELADIMQKFNKPHLQIHCVATQLLEAINQPNGKALALSRLEKEKHTTFTSLLNLFELAKARLNDMIKQVVIVIETQGKVFAIDLDNIEQMEEFQEDNWLKDHAHLEHQHPCYDGFFQKEHGDLYVNINPNRLMQ